MFVPLFTCKLFRECLANLLGQSFWINTDVVRMNLCEHKCLE